MAGFQTFGRGRISAFANTEDAAFRAALRPPATPDEYPAWVMRLTLGVFDIWALRGTSGVYGPLGLRHFEGWLSNYRQAMLSLAGEHLVPYLDSLRAPKSVTDALSERFRAEVGLELDRVVSRWRAAALAQVAENRGRRLAADHRKPAATDDTVLPDPDVPETDRQELVTAVLQRAEDEFPHLRRLVEKDYWIVAKRSDDRQFRHWKRRTGRETQSDNKDFRAVAQLTASEFVAKLQKIGRL